MNRPAMIIQQRDGHTYIWRFQERDAAHMEAIIEDQYCEPHPGFEDLMTWDALEAMREARMLVPKPKATPKRTPMWYAGFTFMVGMAYAATRGKQ